MEIHRPHAAKSWREFAIEIGTIVIGILIALGLEQAVDAAHKRSETAEATAAIHAEMKLAMALIHNRDLSKQCINTRIEELQRTLIDAKAGRFLSGPTWVGHPSRWLMPTARWDFMASAGRLALLSPADQQTYAELHRRISDINNDLLLEQADWAQLRTLEYDSKLSPQQIAALNAALQDSRNRVFWIDFGMKRADEAARAIGINAVATSADGVRQMCLPFPVSADAARQALKAAAAIRSGAR